MKINININDELLAKVDDFAKRNYQSRTSFINMVINSYFEQQKSVEVLTKLEPLLNALASGETVNQEQFDNLVK